MIFEIEPTMRCNLHCEFCSHGANHKRVKGDELTREDWDHNLSHFLPDDDLVITGGEPTLYKDLEYIIDRWVEKFNKPVLRITSNGIKWKRLLSLRDRIEKFNFSYYPGENDSQIKEILNIDFNGKSILEMDGSDLWNVWDVWLAPKKFELYENAYERIKAHCGLRTNKLVCRTYVWPCCVGALFYRRIKGLPQFHGGTTIGSDGWREKISEISNWQSLCKHCFTAPRIRAAEGDLVPSARRELKGFVFNKETHNRVFQQAFDHHKNGKIDEAMKGYLRVLHFDPEHPSALYLRGLIAFEQLDNNIDWDRFAIPFLEKSIELAPNELRWILNYAGILKKMGRLEKSVTLYEKALSVDSHCIEAMKSLGDVYNKLSSVGKETI